MKKILFSLFFLVTIHSTFAQKVYFIYIQSESGQPFFVKMKEKILSSSSSGYIILSKLLDSTYGFNIGFPQNQWPEQKFTVSVDKKDHGYLLKNFGQTQWGIFDLQSLSVQMAAANIPDAAAIEKTENKDVSQFTEILSKASDDPSLKEKPVQQKEEEKKTVVIVQEIPVIKDTVNAKPAGSVGQVAIKNEVINDTIQNIPAANTQLIEQAIIKIDTPSVQVADDSVIKTKERIDNMDDNYKKSVVTKKSESSTTEGFGLVFTDEYPDGNKDTIKILIPNPKPQLPVIKEVPKEEKKFLDITAESTVKSDEKKEDPKPVPADAAIVIPVTKNNCNVMAADSDFYNLRKLMAAAVSDDDMITEAKKYFKIKCFTVSQVRNLGALFLNDEGKYKFFDAVYKNTADAENFSALQAELKEEYYINRFKAMLRN